MAAAAAIPIVPELASCAVTSSFMPPGPSKSDASNELSGELGSLMSSLIIPELMEVVMVKLPWMLPPVETRLFIIEREDVPRTWVQDQVRQRVQVG